MGKVGFQGTRLQNTHSNHHHLVGFSKPQTHVLQESIETHLAEQLTLDTFAQLVRMSTYKLLRSFHKSFGTTPAQYINAQRVRRVRWLLSHTTKDITTITFDTGFASHSHLSMVFSTHTGLTPQQWSWRLSKAVNPRIRPFRCSRVA